MDRMPLPANSRPSEPESGVLILGGDFQALGAARSLSKEGVPVILVDDEPNIARYSRCLKDRFRVLRLHESLHFADRLIDLAIKNKLRGWILLPNDDELIMLLSKNKEALSEYFVIPVPSWEIARKYYYKDETYELARRISVPVPRDYSGPTIEEILDHKPGFPMVLKPRTKEKYYPISRKKAIRVNDPTELRSEHRNMSLIIDPSEIVAQEFIPGGGKNLFSYAAFFDGQKIIAGMAANRLRQHPREFGHATTFAVSVDIPELRELSERLFREIGFYGIAEVEFMWDEREKTYKFIEINGRIWGWHTLAEAAGVNLPHLLYLYSHGRTVGYIEPRVGIKWIRSITDIPTCIVEILSGHMSLMEYIRSMKGTKEYAVFSRSDPIPFLMEFLLLPYLWWKRGF